MKSTCSTRPCKNCPWRKTTAPGGDAIPNFDQSLMRSLANCFPPKGSKQDGFHQVFACHHTKDDQVPRMCTGYLLNQLSQNIPNIHVRLIILQNKFDIDAITQASEGIELYDSFWSMLDEYEMVNAGGNVSGSGE
tara:strand:- start:1266 stop:1670 length:405 start_codon:yes stop_codon:yes gene_type:complete